MSKEQNGPLTDHDYDGIQEYDNPLPTWWLSTFFLTIIFAFIYFIHYYSGSGPSLTEELTLAMKDLEAATAIMAPAHSETESELADLMKDPKLSQLGASVFDSKCAACHRKDLGGQIGPNLADEFWIHGRGDRLDIVKTVREGVADKGMPPWATLLSKDEIYGVVSYILSKKGSHPANGKAPQGEKVE